MNKQYLDKIRYSWEQDNRHLKVNDSIPASRCFICARTFLHAQYAISFCSECDVAMSNCKDGPRNDYSSFLNSKQALANRDLREPIDFELESTLKRLEKETPNFTMATGKPLFKSTGNEEEDERIRRLYEL